MKFIQDLKLDQGIKVLRIEQLKKVKGKGKIGGNVVVIWPKNEAD